MVRLVQYIFDVSPAKASNHFYAPSKEIAIVSYMNVIYSDDIKFISNNKMDIIGVHSNFIEFNSINETKEMNILIQLSGIMCVQKNHVFIGKISRTRKILFESASEFKIDDPNLIYNFSFKFRISQIDNEYIDIYYMNNDGKMETISKIGCYLIL